MFWKTQVRVSEQVYQNNRSIIYFLRLAGLFPLTVKNCKSGLLMQWSLWYALYSYVLGAVVLGLSLYGQTDDIFTSRGESIYIIFQTDKYVRLFGLFAHCSLTFSGIFVVSGKIRKFFDYIECINQVDVLVKTTHGKWEKHTPILTLLLILTPVSVALFLESYIAYIVLGPKIGITGIMKRNLAITLSCEITLMVEYTNQHLVRGLEKRLVRLNKLLEAQHQRIAKKTKNSTLNQHKFSIQTDEMANQQTFHCTNDAIVVKLRTAYLKLMDAVRILNDILGPNTLLAIMSVSLLLVVSPYFIVSILEGKRGKPLELPTRMLIFALQIMKVVLITDPWYYCFLQIQITKGWVCKLLSLKTSQLYRRQVDNFAMALGLRKCFNSVYGLFVVDRYLITSLIRNATTLLVILLQAQQHDIN